MRASGYSLKSRQMNVFETSFNIFVLEPTFCPRFEDDLPKDTHETKMSLVYREWKRSFREQERFLRSGRPAALLTLALSKMPNLQTVEVGEWCKPGSRFEFGWGGYELQALYGESLSPIFFVDMEKHLDFGETLPGRDLTYTQGLTYNFNTLLTALSITRHPLHELSAYLWTDSEGFDDDMHGVEVPMLSPLDCAVWEGLRRSMRDMRSLTLVLEYSRAGCTDITNKRWKTWLPELLALTPKLQRLSLLFDELDHSSSPAKNYPALGALASRLRLEHLTSLELGNAAVSSRALTGLLGQLTGTLTHLILCRLGFRNRNQGRIRWAEVLTVLAHERSPLILVKLVCLYENQNTVVAFSTEGLRDCNVCQESYHHISRVYQTLECKHVMYCSKQGKLPTNLGVFAVPSNRTFWAQGETVALESEYEESVADSDDSVCIEDSDLADESAERVRFEDLDSDGDDNGGNDWLAGMTGQQ